MPYNIDIGMRLKADTNIQLTQNGNFVIPRSVIYDISMYRSVFWEL